MRPFAIRLLLRCSTVSPALRLWMSKPRTPMPDLWQWFECTECGFDSDEAKRLATIHSAICPLCAGDTGRDVDLVFRDATPEEIKRLVRFPGVPDAGT